MTDSPVTKSICTTHFSMQRGTVSAPQTITLPKEEEITSSLIKFPQNKQRHGVCVEGRGKISPNLTKSSPDTLIFYGTNKVVPSLCKFCEEKAKNNFAGKYSSYTAKSELTGLQDLPAPAKSEATGVLDPHLCSGTRRCEHIQVKLSLDNVRCSIERGNLSRSTFPIAVA